MKKVQVYENLLFRKIFNPKYPKHQNKIDRTHLKLTNDNIKLFSRQFFCNLLVRYNQDFALIIGLNQQ